MNRILLSFSLLILLSSCEKMFEYHPNEIRPEFTELNAKNLSRLQETPVQPDFKFILFGDTQRSYDELERFVKHANQLPDITFIILNGDITDFGLNREFNWVAEQLVKLKAPVISVLGNHDMIANGTAIYRKMFGPENFSFNYGNNRFVVLNTNSRELNFDGTVPDIGWLTSELARGAETGNLFVVSHVAPYSPDFDRNLEQPYTQALEGNSRVRASLHAHEHSYKLSRPYKDEIDYLQVGSTLQRNYALITVTGNQFVAEEKYY